MFDFRNIHKEDRYMKVLGTNITITTRKAAGLAKRLTAFWLSLEGGR